MYYKKSSTAVLLLAGVFTALLYSCKDDKDVTPSLNVTLSVTKDTTVNVGDSIIIEAIADNNVPVTHSWKINDTLTITGWRLAYKPGVAAKYVIKYEGSRANGTKVNKELTVDVVPKVRPVTGTSSKYISVVYEYFPAPGQFVNESIGTPEGAQKIIGGTSNMVHLGAFGGYVIFGFDHSIVNKSGADLAIYGNPLKTPTEWSEPGIVVVSQDINGNGIPDDPWYELAGSQYNAEGTIKNYKVTYYNPKAVANVIWKDNRGNSDTVLINRFHNHQYYPLFAANQDSITFEGTVMSNTFGLMPGSSVYINAAFAWGYADNWSTDATKDPYETNMYNSLDIAWAVDKDGKAVTLNAIDFVKVYTGQNCKGNTLLGEVSTEVRGAADLNME
ncbi:PKD domain-containing protein [Chitinophaga tropicalis]|uniref:PKD domain-containing protein n=1 Tax=Chitinophaga tropicalis TaxID=2683588 RepID=A0A7K1U9W8_9BACT|nr:PKD domain-containing protein [Chitinophaga tropicalis]MVT11164.1 PKD domain-containing protein [Chitinophaga tropicalis]